MGRVGGGSQPWQVKSVLGGRLSFDREEGRGRAATKGALLRSWPPPPDLRDAQRGGARGRPGTPLRGGDPCPKQGHRAASGEPRTVCAGMASGSWPLGTASKTGVWDLLSVETGCRGADKAGLRYSKALPSDGCFLPPLALPRHAQRPHPQGRLKGGRLRCPVSGS